jgi:two-component system chemotaxis response regulator CheB
MSFNNTSFNNTSSSNTSSNNTGHNIIVVGASAGGVEALTQLARHLPSNLPAAVFMVLHMPSKACSAMLNILNRAGPLKAKYPLDEETIQPGYIYFAPPDYHLLIKPGSIHLTRGARENNCRPAVDPLFRTAAKAYGQQVVGVILSGTLDDGTAGLSAIKSQAGIAVVQDPTDATFSGMPENAIAKVKVDHILPLSEIPPLLVRLAHEPVVGLKKPVSDDIQYESDIAAFDIKAIENDRNSGKLSGFACPSCGGTLWEIDDGDLLRFRCRVGHAWSEENFVAEQSESLEEALWVALRALEESAALSLKLAHRAQERKQDKLAERFANKAHQTRQRARLIQNILVKGSHLTETPADW